MGHTAFLYRFGASCGIGATTSPVATKPTLGCGVGANPLVFIYTEVGVMGPQANRSNFSGYLSNDFIWPIVLPGKTPANLGGHPIALVGYTRMFETGHALDYGIGFEHHVNNAIRCNLNCATT